MAQGQAAEFVAQGWRCARCGRERACKGHHQVVFRTPFGKLTLDSPQLYRCPCEAQGTKSVSPLAELLPERTSPELVYLETKFAALVFYGLSIKRKGCKDLLRAWLSVSGLKVELSTKGRQAGVFTQDRKS